MVRSVSLTPTPPSPSASPGASRRGSTSGAPASARRAISRLRADLFEHGDRRHVQRQLQRAAHGDGALEGEIEILRRVAAVADRPVLDQRLGMDQPVLEAEPVDERLQRRARRAHRRREVDLARAALVEIIGRGDPGEHLAGCVVDDHDGDRHVRPERAARGRARGPPASSARTASMVSRISRSSACRRSRRRRHAARSAALACARAAPALAWRARSRRR